MEAIRWDYGEWVPLDAEPGDESDEAEQELRLALGQYAQEQGGEF